MTRTGSLRARLALAVGASAIALGAAELALRAWPSGGGLKGLHEARPDKAWLYGLRPGAERTLERPREIAYRINTLGFRDRDRTAAKPAGAFRVLVLGDSLAFGYGVTRGEGFPALLESLAQERAPDADIEVWNLGVGGYNPWNEAALLADVGPQLDPDLVLVQFCINDLNDPTLHFDGNTRLALPAIPEAAFPDPRRRAGQASPRSRARTACARSRVCDRVAQFVGSPLDPTDWDAAFVPIDGDRDRTEWQWLANRYALIAQTASRLGADLWVLAFPFRAQVSEGDRGDVQAALTTIGVSGGWQTIDLLPSFASAARADGPLFHDVWHPTARGHRVAAEEIFSALACAGALPEAPGAPTLACGARSASGAPDG